jgi:hypothetical protein
MLLFVRPLICGRPKMAANGLRLGEVAGLEALTFKLALMLI